MPIVGALMGFSLFSGLVAIPVGNIASTQMVAQTATTTPSSSSYRVTLTAYNAVAAQTDSSPLQTASGAYSNPEVIAARSVDLAKELPFGTIIELDGTSVTGDSCGFNVVKPLIGYRVIEDSMNPRYTSRVDVLLDTKEDFKDKDGTPINAAVVLGICKSISIHVVGHIDLAHIPKTQIELAALVDKSSNLAIK